MQFVRITHPEVDGGGVVSLRALRHYETSGWRLADSEQPSPGTPPVGAPDRPLRNDKTEVWRAHAVATGALTQEQADAMPRDGDDGLIAYFDRLDLAATTPTTEEP